MRRALAAVCAAAALLVTAGCTATPATPATPGASATPSPSISTIRPSASTTTDAAPTCLTLLDARTVRALQSAGWQARQDPFRLGSAEVPGGLECTWGDFSIPSDNVQVFGWAPISESAAQTAQRALLDQGWRRLDQGGRTYFTEDPANSMHLDADGFGFTYLFGDGWVKASDTKQGLLLVVWPPVH